MSTTTTMLRACEYRSLHYLTIHFARIPYTVYPSSPDCFVLAMP